MTVGSVNNSQHL